MGGYSFGRGCDTPSTQNPQLDFPAYTAFPLGIRDAHGSWLSLSGSTGVLMTDDKTVWTAMERKTGYALRASGPSSQEAGLWLHLDSRGSLMGSVHPNTSWK